MNKAVIYSRVSTLEQDYASQTKDLQRQAERMGYEVIRIYEEKESGYNDDRTELAKVLALNKADTDAVFVWEISRLSRKTVTVLTTVENIEQKGILIYALNENYRSWNEKGVKDSTSKLVLTLYASIAEAEALKFKERVRRGKRYSTLIEKKSYSYNKVYGYDKDESGRLIINEEEAAIIREMFTLAKSGYSAKRIKLHLEATYGIKWVISTVCKMLQNTAYMGKKRMGTKRYYGKDLKRLEDGSKVRFYNPDTDIVTTPAIIDEDTFNEVQYSIAGRKTRSKAKDVESKTLLKGLVRCARCGSIYTNTSRVYTCSSATNEKKERCGATSIGTYCLENVVWNVTYEVFSDAISKELAAKNARSIEDEIVALNMEIANYQAVIASKRQELNTIINLAIAAKSKSNEVFVKRIEGINDEMDAISNEIKDRKTKVSLLQKKLDSPAEVMEITDEGEKFDYLHKVIEEIHIYGDFKHKIIAINYLNGITVYCISVHRKWFWFFGDGDLVIADAAKMIADSHNKLKLKDSIYITVTSSNNTYYSGDDTDVEIFDTYTTESFFNAMENNKQLHKVKALQYNYKWSKKAPTD